MPDCNLVFINFRKALPLIQPYIHGMKLKMALKQLQPKLMNMEIKLRMFIKIEIQYNFITVTCCRRTVKTQTTKHTIQKQTYQTYAVEDKDKPDQTIIQTKESTVPLGNKSVTRSPVVHTKTRTVAYEKGSEPHENIDPIGELVSTKTITTGNRTVEILTVSFSAKDIICETHSWHGDKRPKFNATIFNAFIF